MQLNLTVHMCSSLLWKSYAPLYILTTIQYKEQRKKRFLKIFSWKCQQWCYLVLRIRKTASWFQNIDISKMLFVNSPLCPQLYFFPLYSCAFITPFVANVFILYLLRKQENFWFSDVFRRYKMGTLSQMGSLKREKKNKKNRLKYDHK